MRVPVCVFVLAVSALAAGAAHAGDFDPNPGLPGAKPDVQAVRHISDERPASPYPMTYSDEVAQSLGVRNGHMDLFAMRAADGGLVPTLTGGVDSRGAMLKLQWHPGE